MVSVRAMKMTPTSPPRLSPWAEALSRKLGRRISKSPSKLRPKARNRAATSRFSHGLLARFWRNEAEKKNENKTPTAVKIPMIARQYVTASPVVFPLPLPPCPCLTKKLTVTGIIGQTQGITSAKRPPRAEAKRNGIKPSWARLAISLTGAPVAGAVEGAGSAGLTGSTGRCLGRLDGRRGRRAQERRPRTRRSSRLPGTMFSVTSGSVQCPGGKHERSLQIWYPAWHRSVRLPGVASAGTVRGMLQVTSFSKNSMIWLLKAGSGRASGAWSGFHDPAIFNPAVSKKSKVVGTGPSRFSSGLATA